jgi:nucleoid-associated protein YgaU
MRKDVKFGMTIGAILVVTLVVYIIVLYRGGNAPGSHSDKVAIVSPTADSDAGTHAPDASATAAPTRLDSGPASPGDNSSSALTPPASADVSTPATQPSASAGAPDAWDAALNHGVVKMLAADAGAQRTETPTIDHPDAPIRADVVAQDGHAPLVDSPAATQPSMAIAIPAPGPAGQRTHVIHSGENLWSISAEVYGNSKYWKQILAANPGLDPKNLRVGKTLTIPELSDVPKAQPADSSFAAVVADPNTSYKVVSGDSLERIAIRLYGNAQMKDSLYEANKTLIGPDEDRLKIGWVLKLPQPPTVSAAASR